MARWACCARKTSSNPPLKSRPRPVSAVTLHSISFFLERYEAAYLAEMRAFIAAATGGTPADPGIVDGLQAQILADAATLSRETGQPVDLPAA